MKRIILAAIGLCFVAACNPEVPPAAPAEVETRPLTEPPVVQVGEVCGGITDAVCEGEGDTTYCKPNPGSDDTSGICTLIEEDGASLTDPAEVNSDTAGRYGLTLSSTGTCGGKDLPQECPGETEACILPIGQCNSPDTEGMCIDTTAACIGPQVVVCGCDGKTYGSPCAAYQAGAGVAHYNECAVDE